MKNYVDSISLKISENISILFPLIQIMIFVNLTISIQKYLTVSEKESFNFVNSSTFFCVSIPT